MKGIRPLDSPAEGGGKPRAIPDAAVISVFYGGFSPLRREAALASVTEWGRQDAVPEEALFLELVCPGERPCLSQDVLPQWLRYMRICGKERNRNIFQKEALWNISARLVSASRLLFIDADCYPQGCSDWFARLFDSVRPGRVVHPCTRLIHCAPADVGEDEYWSIMAPDADVPRKARRFPGLGYGLHRRDYDAMDGFNPFAICGSGDAVFLWESCPAAKYPVFTAKRFHHGITRQGRPALEPYAVPGVTLLHHYHGRKEDRGYCWSRELVQLFGMPQSYCHIDRSGLVAWNDPRFWLADFLTRKERMHTKGELLALVTETAQERLDAQERMQREPDAKPFMKEDFYDN